MTSTAINQQIEAFLQGEKSFDLPFDLTLSKNSGFQCSEVLRLLPSKRLVLLAAQNDQKVVIKLFAAAKKGEREFNKEIRGHALALAAGVDVPKLISSHESVDGYYAVVYEFLDEAHSFADKEIWGNKDNILALFSLMAKLHEYGIYQDDIHLDNLMLRDGKLFLIDLGSVECEREGETLSKAKSLKNLARLVAQFPPLEQAQIIQSLSHYYSSRSWQWDDESRELFVKQLKQAWQRRKKEYLNKCFRTCTMTKYGRTFSTEYAFRSDFINELSVDLINDVEALMSQGEVLKAGNSATVVRVKVDGKDLVIKRYNIKNVWHLLRRTLRQSRAAVSWRNANLLEFIDLPTLKPLGFIERRQGRFRTVAYFISEYHQAEELLDVYHSRQPTESELEQISNIFLLMQNSLISHGDLKAQNLLIDADGKVILIDLDSMKDHRSTSEFEKIFNKDKKRFLRNWQDLNIKQMFESLLF